MAESQQEFWKCVQCHRTTDKTTCPSCGNECRKRKGVHLVQDVHRWPSARKVTKYNVPRHLENLVRKCPQWEETIAALVKSNDNYKHFTYKEMEQEISGREILRCTWKMMKDKANNLVTGIQKRADSLSRSTSFPLSAQNSFNSSIENKAESLRKLADKFLFGGEIYLRSRLTKCTTTGLLEWKTKANRLRDVPLYEELLGYFNDVNDLKCFLARQLPEIKEYLRKTATIQRDYNLDLQAKGVTGKATRANAKRKRDERMVEMGKGKTNYVPVARRFLDLQGDVKKVRKTILLTIRHFLRNVLRSAETIFTYFLFTVKIFQSSSEIKGTGKLTNELKRLWTNS